MTAYNKILEQIILRCEANGWSRYRLAKESDIPLSSLNNMFLRNTVPSFHTVEKICAAFHITLGEFYGALDEGLDPEDVCFVLTNEEKTLIENYRSMNKKKKDFLQIYVKGLLEINPDAK